MQFLQERLDALADLYGTKEGKESATKEEIAQCMEKLKGIENKLKGPCSSSSSRTFSEHHCRGAVW